MEKEIKIECGKKEFTLRPFRKSDAADIAQYINNKIIFRNTLNIPYPYSIKDARDWLDHTLPMYRRSKPKKFNLAIVINSQAVGSISLEHLELNHKAELGYWLAEQYWGQGIMSAAVAYMTRYGFNKFGLKRIYAKVFVYNKVSQKVLLRNGFSKEGLMRKDVKKENKFIDSVIFAKIKK